MLLLLSGKTAGIPQYKGQPLPTKNHPPNPLQSIRTAEVEKLCARIIRRCPYFHNQTPDPGEGLEITGKLFLKIEVFHKWVGMADNRKLSSPGNLQTQAE